MLVVDDHTLMREVLVGVVEREADLEVIGSAGDGSTAVGMALYSAPDVVVMDIAMPTTDGITATRVLSQVRPAARTLVLSASCQRWMVRSALAAGAWGYLLKDGPPEALVEGIRAVSRGERAFAPLVRKLLDS